MNENPGAKHKRPKWKLALFYFIAILVILVIGNVFLNWIIQKELRKRLDQLSPTLKVSYASIRTNLFTLSLSIRDLNVRFNPDTADRYHQHSLHSSDVEFNGINFFKVIFNKRLSVNTFTLENTDVHLSRFLLSKKNAPQHGLFANMPFTNISLDHLDMLKCKVWLDTVQENSLLLKGNINLYKIDIHNLDKPISKNNIHFGDIKCNVSEIKYSIPGAFHALYINRLMINSNVMLRMDSLRIIPLYSKMEFVEKTNHQVSRVEASVSSIEILNLDFMKLLDQKFNAGKIFIDQSVVHIYDSQKKIKALPHNWSQIPREIRIDSFVLNRSSLTYEVHSGADLLEKRSNMDSLFTGNISINHFEVSEARLKFHSKQENQCNIDKIIVNKLNNSDKNNFRFDALKIDLSKIIYATRDELYTLRINKLMFDSKKDISRIESITIMPRFGKLEFGRKLAHQADRLEATVAGIEISNLDPFQLLRKKLIADKVTVNNPVAHVFRDRRLPRELKKQLMPNGYLKQVPLEVRLNTFKINNAFVDYEEFPKDGTQSGTLEIARMNISMSPVLNRPRKNDPGYSDTYVSGSIMNSGMIEASIHAPLERNIYTVKGGIKNLDLTKLSSSAENLGKFHIESGLLNNLDFHFIATEEKATGEIVGEYHNLIIDKLKEKKGKKKIAKVPSFLLKHLIIPKNKDKALDVSKRTGKIDYKRDPTRMVTFYLLKSLLSGIRASFKLGFLLPQ